MTPILSPFQVQITASVHERTLWTTVVTIAVPTVSAAAVREPTLLFIIERGFISGKREYDEEEMKNDAYHWK